MYVMFDIHTMIKTCSRECLSSVRCPLTNILLPIFFKIFTFYALIKIGPFICIALMYGNNMSGNALK